MSGHSHWAGIKHRKGINDAKRAKIFTKYGKLITLAAKSGGGSLDTNFQLRLIVERARSENMPKDNIERAIKRGTGELKDGTEIEEIIYEAYGPGNVPMLIKAATDNRNRTVSELKAIFNKLGGKMVPAGSVSFLFKQVGSLDVVLDSNKDRSEIELLAIEAGAQDVSFSDNLLRIQTNLEDLMQVKEELEKNKFTPENVGLIYVSAQKTILEEKDRLAYTTFLEALDEQDDVEEIFDNL